MEISNSDDREMELIYLRERYTSLERYWERESQVRLSKLVSTLKRYFNHELQEAVMCLERDKPNIPMALSRIHHMKDYISDMVKSRE